VILQDVIDGKRGQSLSSVLEDLLEPARGKKASDDIRVRSYIVRSHWRRRWFPNGKRKKTRG
jgi:hypothetical protein